MIQPYLDISDSPFSSSDLQTMELLLLISGTPNNITILYDSISSIPYISQVPSSYPISDQFPMSTHCNIYMIAIDN